jgi:hypothetical protein
MANKKSAKKNMSKKNQKGGSKKQVAKKVVAAEPVVAEPVVAEPVVAEPVVAKKTSTKKQAGGAKKTPAKKTVAKKATPVKEDTEADTEVAVNKNGKKVRSFKAQLPGFEEFAGRYTGSTPYQAANKALSKYFRTTDKPKSVISFSIRESTRGSKHNVYSYQGHRTKLETPITYTTKDGNTIVKNHKNQLKKVKKCDAKKEEI